MSNPRTLIVLSLAILAAALCAAGCSDASSDASTADAATEPVVLRVADRSYTLEQLDEKAKEYSLKPYQDLYEHRRQAMDRIVAEVLIDAEAAKEGISGEDYMRREISERIVVSDPDVAAFYEQNQSAMGGRPLDDDLRVQIRNFIEQQKRNLARQELMGRLRSQAQIEMKLEAPRIELAVAPNEPARGPADAPVTIVEYSDFQCPYCAKVGPTLDRIVQTYPDKVRIVFRDFPLPMHAEAQPAAEAARCAQEQGQFWAYHDKLFASQQQFGSQAYKQYAAELGLDADRFGACYDEGRYRQEVLLHTRMGQQFGVTGTPTFFVNGRYLSGTIPFERFQALIEEELARTPSAS